MPSATEELVHRCLVHLSALPFVEQAALHERTLADDLDGSVELDTLDDRDTLLEARGHRDWPPGRKKDALASWLEGFATTLAPSLVIGRFRAMERDTEALERRIEPVLDAACKWRYGGGAAAARLTQHYRGDTTLIYTLDAPADLPARLRLVPDPRSGPIVLARSAGVVAFESPDARSVHPPLAYADLLSDGGDRAREAAAELNRRYLVELETA